MSVFEDVGKERVTALVANASCSVAVQICHLLHDLSQCEDSISKLTDDAVVFDCLSDALKRDEKELVQAALEPFSHICRVNPHILNQSLEVTKGLLDSYNEGTHTNVEAVLAALICLSNVSQSTANKNRVVDKGIYFTLTPLLGSENAQIRRLASSVLSFVTIAVEAKRALHGHDELLRELSKTVLECASSPDIDTSGHVENCRVVIQNAAEYPLVLHTLGRLLVVKPDVAVSILGVTKVVEVVQTMLEEGGETHTVLAVGALAYLSQNGNAKACIQCLDVKEHLTAAQERLADNQIVQEHIKTVVEAL